MPPCGSRPWRRRDAHPSCAQLCELYQETMANKPIFFDASGRRAARIKVLAWAAGLALLVISVGFAASLTLAPPVRGLVFPQRAAPAPLLKRAQKPGLLARAERLA